MSERPSLKPVYLITGSDRPKVETAVQRLRARFLDEATEIVTALEATGADAVNLCNAGSLFGDARLVVVNEVDGRRKEEGRPPTGRLEGRGRGGGRRLPAGARARHGARARRARGEEGLGPREGVREGRRPARLRRPQAQARRLGRRPVPAGGRQGRARCVRTPDRVRRRGGPPRSRERDRQDRDVGAGRADRGERGRAARLARRGRAVVCAHRRLGRTPAGPAARDLREDARALGPAAARHRAEADRLAQRPPDPPAPAEASRERGRPGPRGRAEAEDAPVLRREGLPPGGGVLGRGARRPRPCGSPSSTSR